MKKKKTLVPIATTSSKEPKKVVEDVIQETHKENEKGLEKDTASTGTPMKDLKGGALMMAQLSNIGGGSKKTGGNGVKGGLNLLVRHEKAKSTKNTMDAIEKQATLVSKKETTKQITKKKGRKK